MLSIIGFLVILAPLVIVHEFGHYIFARIFGVKAEIFSIGFGPRIFSRQMGETEVRVSAIPLGGYVKLLGEERDVVLSPEDQKRSLHRQAAWKRFFIFFGGPLFNFLFAIVVFMVILVLGEPQIASVIGRVVHGSAAERAGFQSGDRVAAIAGKPVKKFEEIIAAINDHPRKDLVFSVVHSGATQPVDVKVQPVAQDGFSVYGETADVGEVDGLLPIARTSFIGVSNADSIAGKAGVETGDQIIKFNGLPVSSWEEMEQRFRQVPVGEPVQFVIKKGGKNAEKTLELSSRKLGQAGPLGGASIGDMFGLHSTELFIEKTIEGSPASKSGLQPGDRLMSVRGQYVASFYELRDAVQRAGEKEGKVVVTWERAGREMRASIVPTATSGRDPLLKKTVQYTVGVVPMLTLVEPVTVTERVLNPFTLVWKASERMVLFSWRNLVSVGKMFTGDVSVATLGGPIMIGKIAGDSLSRGLLAFLTTMAILSVGLGVLNILPVPVLDGGHLLLLGIEAIRGKPLSLRQMEVVQQVGLSLILLLMVVVIKNDLSRLPFFE